MIFTDYRGHSVDVPVAAIEPELGALIRAADEACGASTTAPEVERLRHARKRFMDALDRLAVLERSAEVSA